MLERLGLQKYKVYSKKCLPFHSSVHATGREKAERQSKQKEKTLPETNSNIKPSWSKLLSQTKKSKSLSIRYDQIPQSYILSKCSLVLKKLK